MKKEWKSLGQFHLSFPRLAASDPAYRKPVIVENCLNGNWDAFILVSDEGEWGMRVAALAACVEGLGSELRKAVESNDMTRFDEDVRGIGVDSGQAGFFDLSHYQCDADIDISELGDRFDDWGPSHSPWYLACCKETLSEDKAGVIPFGVVSSSGYGDGCYQLYTHENETRWIDMAVIRFI